MAKFNLPALQKLLSRGSQKAPALIDDVVEGVNPIMRRASTEAVEVGPQVIGKASKAAKVAADIPDAVLSEATSGPNSWMDKMNPALKKILLAGGGAAAIGGGMSMMGGDEELPPVEPVQAVAPIAPEAPKEVPVEQVSQVEDALSGIRKLTERADPVDQSTPYVDMMKEAQKSQKNHDLAALLAQGGADIAAGFGAGSGLRDKPDYSLADHFTGQGKQGVENVTKLMATDASESQLKKARSEMNDDNKMRNPNSEISKLVSDVAAKAGLIAPGSSVSAMTLKNSGINLGNLLATMEAAKGRKETAELNARAKSDKAETKLNDDQKKFARDLRKELTAGQLGKQYASYSTGERMGKSIAEFAKDPNGYSDYASLMGSLKSLQGDESVVREAEVRMGMGATSKIDSVKNDIQKAINGKMLQPGQRTNMINTLKILTDISKEQYLRSAEPILEQADREGISRDILLPGTLNGKPKESAGSQFSPKQEAGIAAFMGAKNISREEAVKRLKAGGRL